MNKLQVPVLCGFLSIMSCDHTNLPNNSGDYSFERYSPEETIAWVQEKLTKSMVSTFDQYPAIRLIHVTPCVIVYGYEMPVASGGSIMHKVEIPTGDIRINEDGSMLYTTAVIPNCPVEGGQKVLLRQTVKEFKISPSGRQNNERLTLVDNL